MDLSFQRTYGTWLLRNRGTADRWTPTQQLRIAYRAHSLRWKGHAPRGWYPWPNSARRCGLSVTSRTDWLEVERLALKQDVLAAERRAEQAEAREAAWLELGAAMLDAGLLRGEWAPKVRAVLAAAVERDVLAPPEGERPVAEGRMRWPPPEEEQP